MNNLFGVRGTINAILERFPATQGRGDIRLEIEQAVKQALQSTEPRPLPGLGMRVIRLEGGPQDGRVLKAPSGIMFIEVPVEHFDVEESAAVDPDEPVVIRREIATYKRLKENLFVYVSSRWAGTPA